MQELLKHSLNSLPCCHNKFALNELFPYFSTISCIFYHFTVFFYIFRTLLVQLRQRFFFIIFILFLFVATKKKLFSSNKIIYKVYHHQKDCITHYFCSARSAFAFARKKSWKLEKLLRKLN